MELHEYYCHLFLLEILIFLIISSASPLLTYFILGTMLLLLIPHIILIFYIFHKLVKKIDITHCLKKEIETLKRCMQATRPTSEAEKDVETQSDSGSLPDRLINPGENKPVLPTTCRRTQSC